MSRLFRFSTILAFLFISYFSSAQKIEVSKNFWAAYKIEQNDATLKLKDLKVKTENLPNVNNLINKAQNNFVFSTILSLIGGGLIGYSVTDILVNDKDRWGMLATGSGLTIIGLILQKTAYKKLVEGVEIYNRSQGYTSAEGTSFNLKMISNARGIGLGINF